MSCKYCNRRNDRRKPLIDETSGFMVHMKVTIDKEYDAFLKVIKGMKPTTGRILNVEKDGRGVDMQSQIEIFYCPMCGEHL